MKDGERAACGSSVDIADCFADSPVAKLVWLGGSSKRAYEATRPNDVADTPKIWERLISTQYKCLLEQR